MIICLQLLKGLSSHDVCVWVVSPSINTGVFSNWATTVKGCVHRSVGWSVRNAFAQRAHGALQLGMS